MPAPGHRFLDLAEAEGHLELLHLGTLGRREVACRPQRDRLLLARAVLAAGAALGSSMPGDARGWHDRGIALGREIGAVALVRAHQAG